MSPQILETQMDLERTQGKTVQRGTRCSRFIS